MSGHSKWSQIKRKKEQIDSKKGQIFTKLAANIALAVKERGGDPKQNFKLRLALEKSKIANMPKESVERAIKKGLGEKDKKDVETTTYEAYGPGKAALLIEVATDNKNRSTSEIRRVLEQNKTSLADSGSVMWLFKKNGLIRIAGKNNNLSKEEIELFAIDKGAENVEIKNDIVEITTTPQTFTQIKKALADKNVKIESSFLGRFPLNKISVKKEDRQKLTGLIAALEKNSDVVRVYHNAC